MNRKLFWLVLVMLSCLAVSGYSQARTFPIDMSVQTSPAPTVTFTWIGSVTSASPMTIDRRVVNGPTTWQVLATVNDPTKTYIDTTVAVGSTYEYRLSMPSRGILVTAMATLQSPLEDERGGIILVVDTATAASLPVELQQLEMDLVGDGWFVKRIDTAPIGIGSAPALKATIKTTWQTTPGINSLFLFGNVPVARSGYCAPDGHYARTHETDTWYADMNDELWTDTMKNYPSSGDLVNENIPGDGKFDQDLYPSSLELSTGRVIFSNMQATRKRDLEYLRDYLHKDHAWRQARRQVNYTAKAGDTGFLWVWYNWLNPMFGTTNVITSAIAATDSRIIASGNENYSLLQPTHAIFTTNFRSYKQTWMQTNNPMVMNMAQPDWGLTCTWGGRPASFLHSMAAGKPIGYGFRVSQNEVRKTGGGDYYASSDELAVPFISYNLLGDPTLRLHPMPTASALQASKAGSAVELTWSAAAATTTPVAGYHVYRSTDRLGNYQRLTSTLTTGLQFTDTSAPAGEVYYQVRAVYLMNLPTTGSYYNQSQGTFTQVHSNGTANRRPTATGGALVTKCNSPLWFSFGGSDPDGDAIVPILLTNPQYGQIRWQNGQPFYVSSKDFSGTETVTYVMSDGVTVSEPADFTFEVNSTGSVIAGWNFSNGVSPYSHPCVLSSTIAVRGYVLGSASSTQDQLSFRPIPTAFDATKYLDWTISPLSDYKVSLDRLSFAVCAPLGSVVGFELRASTDNFVTYTTIPSQFGNTLVGAGTSIRNIGQIDFADLSTVPALQNVSVPVAFRLHFWKSGDPNAGMSIGKLTEASGAVDGIEDVTVTGRVDSTIDPPVEVIIDNASATGVTKTGAWTSSTGVDGYYLTNFLHDGNTAKGSKSVRYTPTLTAAGSYEVFARWTAHPNRASNVPIDIVTATGTVAVQVNQRLDGGQWISLGTYSFNAGTEGSVLISNTATNGYVVADAVRFLPK